MRGFHKNTEAFLSGFEYIARTLDFRKRRDHSGKRPIRFSRGDGTLADENLPETSQPLHHSRGVRTQRDVLHRSNPAGGFKERDYGPVRRHGGLSENAILRAH